MANTTFRRFEEIDAWQEARKLTRMVYAAAKKYDFRRDYPLADQVRRSAISVMSNIAEGYERHGRKEFVRFLSIARASGGELKSELYIALDAEYVTSEEFEELWSQADKTTRMLWGLIKYLEKPRDSF